MSDEKHKNVRRYYQRLGSKLGYDLVMGGIKHFGYYPDGKKNISEKEALQNLPELISKKLDFKPGEKVLDAGSGQGIVSAQFARDYSINVVGITVVPFEIEKSKQYARKLGIENKTEYHLMDYSDMNFPDNHFDSIYALETLSHSQNIDKTLSDLCRVLKPGGRFVFCEYTLAPDEEFNDYELKMLNKVIEGSAMMGLKDFRHNKFPGVLKSVGFKDVNEENVSKNIEPSWRRLKDIASVPYFFVKLLHLHKYFTNTTAAVEYYKLLKKGLFRYCIFTGKK